MEDKELKEEKELMVKILKKITPDTSWHGETWADDRSIENTEVLGEMALLMPSQKRSEKLSKKLDIVILELNIRKGEKLKWKKNILS